MIHLRRTDANATIRILKLFKGSDTYPEPSLLLCSVVNNQSHRHIAS